MLIIPLGRLTRLAKIPFATVGLMLLTIFVYYNTWPAEKRFLLARAPGGTLNMAARELTLLLIEPSSPISSEVRIKLGEMEKEPLFPKGPVDALFEKADKDIQNLPDPAEESVAPANFTGDSYPDILAQTLNAQLGQVKPPHFKRQWQASYARYRQLKHSLVQAGVPEESLFQRYGFSPLQEYFPGILTHIFLHAGFMHLFFNMLLLWVVGASIEERWGPILFLMLYLTGGAAAALAQPIVGKLPAAGMVGASGAVAAIMGAFLIRHYKMPIKFFWLVFLGFFVRAGVATWQAWTLLLLWFGQQLLNIFFSDPRLGNPVAYGAHIGGFVYGALIGLLILKGRFADSWEKEAATTAVGMQLRDQEVTSLLQDREFERAIKILDAQLADNPRHVPALLNAVQAHAIMLNMSRLPALIVRAMNGLTERGSHLRAGLIADQYLPSLGRTLVSDRDAFGLAQAFTQCKRHFDALQWYQYLIQKYPGSPLRAKAIFSVGKLYKELRQWPDAARHFKVLQEMPYRAEWGMMAEKELISLPRLG